MPEITVKDVGQHKVVQGVALYLKKSGKLMVSDDIDLIRTTNYKERGQRFGLVLLLLCVELAPLVPPVPPGILRRQCHHPQL